MQIQCWRAPEAETNSGLDSTYMMEGGILCLGSALGTAMSNWIKLCQDFS